MDEISEWRRHACVMVEQFVTSFRIRRNSPTKFGGLYQVKTHRRRTHGGALSPSCQVAFAHPYAARSPPTHNERTPHPFRLQYILPFSIDKTSDQGRNPLQSLPTLLRSNLFVCLLIKASTHQGINTLRHQPG